MKVVRCVGPSDSGKTTLVERLARRLRECGRVGTVKHINCEPDLDTEGKDTARHRIAGASRTYGLTTDGEWFATGSSRTLESVLDSLAVSCNYALVEGFGEATLPTVALGGSDAAKVIARGETADDVDVETVLDRLADLDSYETLESLVARAKKSPDIDRARSIATFAGRVGTLDEVGDETEHLEFERYDEIAAQQFDAIRDELRARDSVYEVLLHHKSGVVEAGEDIVFVVVLAEHRAEAFETVEDSIDRLKEEVPLFKEEVTVSDEFRVHESSHCPPQTTWCLARCLHY